MKLDSLPTDVQTKTIVRQESDYEEAGLDGNRVVPLPFTPDHLNATAIESLGFSVTGIVRGLNQLLAENVGNLYGARVRQALAKKQPLPSVEDFNELLAAYDFSGTRTSAETGMPEEEKVFRSYLRKQLKDLLRAGSLDMDERGLTVQTQKEVETKELPDGKVSLDEFNELFEAAAEAIAVDFNGLALDFSEEPVFEHDDEDNIASFENFAAVREYARMMAEAEMELRRKAKVVKASLRKTS